MAGSGPDVDDASTFLKVFDGEGLYADTFMRWHNDEYAAILADSWATTDTEQRTEDLVAMDDFLLANGPSSPCISPAPAGCWPTASPGSPAI